VDATLGGGQRRKNGKQDHRHADRQKAAEAKIVTECSGKIRCRGHESGGGQGEHARST
jgi:hypothetical protein